MANGANIRDGVNPDYTVEDFLELYPRFSDINETALDMYLTLANSVIKEARYHEHWKYAMGLAMAHYCTLYAMREKDAANAGGATGPIASKSVDGVSVSYDLSSINSDFTGSGAWKMTQYGQELLTIAKMVGKGGMQIW